MLDIIFGFYAFMFGLISIFFNRIVARETVKFYEDHFGWHYSEKLTRIAFILGGMCFVIIGLLLLLGYTHIGQGVGLP